MDSPQLGYEFWKFWRATNFSSFQENKLASLVAKILENLVLYQTAELNIPEWVDGSVQIVTISSGNGLAAWHKIGDKPLHVVMYVQMTVKFFPMSRQPAW